MANVTTLQVGTYNPSIDQFALVLDLNDRVTFFCQSIDFPQPSKAWVKAFNILVPGEGVQRTDYQNRIVTARFVLLGANAQALINSIHSFFAAVEVPPYVIKVQLAGGTAATHYRVLKVEHIEPYDAKALVSGAALGIEVHFECEPGGFPIPRQYLSNLLMNPGFEAPAGGGIATTAPIVFYDTFANTNAYVLGGSTSLSANVLTLTANATAQFGSPAWGAIFNWQVRFEWFAGTTADFFIHWVDGNNYIQATITGAALQINHAVGGVFNALSSVSCNLTGTTWYWLKFQQFPAQFGVAPYLQASVYNDSSGSVGTLVNQTPIVAAASGTVAVTGRPLIFSAVGSTNIGGNFGNVHLVQLWGPSGWQFNGGGGSGQCSGAWDGTRTELGMSGLAGNTLATPVQSYGAARVELPPAGTVSVVWTPYPGGAPAGTFAVPVSFAGATMGYSAWVKTNNLGIHASIFLVLLEYDSSGNQLRFTQSAALSGNQSFFTQISGSWTTGASCAFASITLRCDDATAGDSANGTLWWDNVQIWNVSATQASMPYCELRFPSSPAQLMVSGLLGDMPAPAYFAFASYYPGSFVSSIATFALGRQAVWQGNTNPTAFLCGSFPPSSTRPPGADIAHDFNGYGIFSSTASALTELDAPYQSVSVLAGTFDFYCRLLTGQSTGNVGNLSVTARGDDTAYAIESPQANPFTAGSTWTVMDTGQIVFPLSPLGGVAGTGVAARPSTIVRDTTSGGSQQFANWWALIPTDGSFIVGTLNAPNGAGALVNWIWVHVDPLGINSGQVGADPAWRYQTTSTALPSFPGSAVGGPGTFTSAFTNVNPLASAYLTLDPTPAGSGPNGVNSFGAFWVDSTANIEPLVAEISYQPLYLYPR